MKTHPGSRATLYLLCFYIFLTIERPWESISFLNELRIERIFGIILLVYAALNNKLRITPAPTNKWVFFLLAIHFLLAPFAHSPMDAVDAGIEYAKIVLTYGLMLSCCEQEEDLQLLIKTFVFSMLIYVIHSFWEYTNGRHVYRMGIVRMIGVGDTCSDPNSFGASILLSFPFAWALERTATNKKTRLALRVYFAIGAACIVLTGSRSSFAGLMVLLLVAGFLAQKGAKRIALLTGMAVIVFTAWQFIPVDKQNRFHTLWNEGAGPANAQESAEGRLRGFHAGWKMFLQKPLTGVGAGGKNFIDYRVAFIDGEVAQAHNLAGEVLGEFGFPGALGLLGLTISMGQTLRKTRGRTGRCLECSQFLFKLTGSMSISLMLLYFLGLGGHNFYRPLWLWVAAWTSLSASLAAQSTPTGA